MISRRLRFRDLVSLGIVRNRVTLQTWIRERGFPPGKLMGPNSRSWSERDVEAWLASRPVRAKPVPRGIAKRGRPRKAESTATIIA
jgi:predicted DNA-binding transcriptional regulator AlpA